MATNEATTSMFFSKLLSGSDRKEFKTLRAAQCQVIKKDEFDFPNYVLQNLHLDVETADVNFIFDIVDTADGTTTTTKKLPAHKTILAGGSIVFRSMFYGELKETNDVLIKDFSYEGFCEFINLFYLSDATVSEENIFEVIRAVDKYDVRGCLPRCEKFLEDVMNEEIACDVLEIAMKLNLLSSITEPVEFFIGENTVNVFRSKSFQCCERAVLTKVLQINKLSCANELAVFRAAMGWAENCCRQKGTAATDINKRTELGECFQLIRFSAMSTEEFLELNEIYPEVFQHEDVIEMLQHKIRGRPLKLFADFNFSKRIFKPAKIPDNLFTSVGSSFKFTSNVNEKETLRYGYKPHHFRFK